MQSKKIRAIHQRLQERLGKAVARQEALAALEQTVRECGGEALRRSRAETAIWLAWPLVALGIGILLGLSGYQGPLTPLLLYGGFIGIFVSVFKVLGGPDHAGTSYGLLMDKVLPARYRLTPVQPPTLDYAACRQRFPDFVRGDEAQQVDRQWNAAYSGPEHAFDYQAYRFRYVIVTREKGSDGKYQTKRTTAYRHGLMAPFPFDASLTLRATSRTAGINLVRKVLNAMDSGSGEVIWNTASAAFEARFEVRTSSSQAASRFLTPVILQALLELPMSDLSLTLIADGGACLSFDDHNWLHPPDAKPDQIEEPALLLADIQKSEALPMLDAALTFLHLCRKYSDDNFRTAAASEVPT